MRTFLIAALLAALAGPCLAASKKLSVKIVDHQDSQSTYGYIVPGYSQTNTTANANCVAYPNSAACTGSSSSTTSSRPAMSGQFQVSGATFTLQLPDGRLAIVNCDSKTNWTEWSSPVRRSCRKPLVGEITAEFDGDKAKLSWPVSIDGKKVESETYKVLGILPKPDPAYPPPPK